MRLERLTGRPWSGWFAAALITLASVSAPAPAPAQTPDVQQAARDADPAGRYLFERHEPLSVTITTNVGQIRRDRSTTTNNPWRAATLTYLDTLQGEVVFPLRLRTRGNWRLKNCQLPPIRMNFWRDSVRRTVFHRQDRLKLVHQCRENETFEQYLLQEFQVYRVYSLLTPFSHRVRLLHLTWVDANNQRATRPRYAFVIDEFEDVAERVGGKPFEIQGATVHDLDHYQQTLFMVFSYMIGNTDVSMTMLHNAQLVQMPDGSIHPVAYDFDFSGAVNAPYATPDKSLPIRSVRDRLFRGFCGVPAEVYQAVFAKFNEQKDAIYALYSDELGSLLQPRRARETLSYFDEFYRIINDERRAQREILGACRGAGG